VSRTVLAIDMGSTKVSVAIAEIEEEIPKVLGYGIFRSQGIKKGLISNIELASKSIKHAVNEAKRVANVTSDGAIISVANGYTKSINVSATITLSHKEVTIKEIERVVKTALNDANVADEDQILHVLPHHFRVDMNEKVSDPLGASGHTLNVDVLVILIPQKNFEILQKALFDAEVEIEAMVLNGYASMIATLSESDKKLGCAIVDIGGQGSSIAIYSGNSLAYSGVLGVGSNHITNDLSMALHTPLQTADWVKCQHGNLIEVSSENINLPRIGDEEGQNQVSLEIVHSVIYARVEETLSLLGEMIKQSGVGHSLKAGIILTGGMCKLKGLRDLAEVVFDPMYVNIATPKTLKGQFEEINDFSFATLIGLILYRAGAYTQYEIDSSHTFLYKKPIVQEKKSESEKSQEDKKNSEACSSQLIQEKEKPKIILEGLPDPDLGSSLIHRLNNLIKSFF